MTTNTNETPANPEVKKKKVKKTIVTPAEIETALCVLQGVLCNVVGVTIANLQEANPVNSTKLQPLYLKFRPQLVGKITYKVEDRALYKALQSNEIEESAIVDLIKSQLEACSSNVGVQLHTLSVTKALELYGKDTLAAYSISGDDPAKEIVLTFIPGVYFSLNAPNDVEYKPVGSIQLDYVGNGDKLATSINISKKTGVLEFGFKFEAFGCSVDATAPTDLPTLADVSALLSPSESKLVRNTPISVNAVTSGSNGGDNIGDSSDEMVVNAFEVKGVIDYNKLVDQFGSKLITDDLLDKFKKVVKMRSGLDEPLHPFLRRNIFFSHRDLHPLLDVLEKGGEAYLYTGRGPSSAAMHLGHLIPFQFTAYLQRALNLPCVIQMTDDEKFIFKGEFDHEKNTDNLTHFANLTIENAKDIVACGFDIKKTFLFSDLEYVHQMYPNILRIWRSVNYSQISGIFGFVGSDAIGKSAFPAIQAAPSFATSFPTVLNAKCALLTQSAVDCDPVENSKNAHIACLIPCAIDQDPYFRMTRDIAHRLCPSTHPLKGKPSLIHSKFFPPLQGSQGKMSSSDVNSAIFLTDTPEEIAYKIKTQAYSGGQETGKLQRELGANLDIDVPYQWLTFFLHDDILLEQIGQDYSTGSGVYWSTGVVKNKLIEVLTELVGAHQARRKVFDEKEGELKVREFMQERCIL